MKTSKVSFTLVCLSKLAYFLVTTCAQNLPQDYLYAHNEARAQVGIRSLVWNYSLAAYAQNYANQLRMGGCNLVHSGGPYGENLAKGSGGSFTGAKAVNLWVAERTYYDHTSNSCVGGHTCQHYTQVVWRQSIELGCARVRCLDYGWSLVICNYNPPGNYVGQSPY